jgi:hypothetical protein
MYVALACFGLAAGCGSSTATGPGGYNGGGPPPPPACVPGAGTVCLVAGNQFSPASITIATGTSITFNNGSGTTHNVTFTTVGSPANVPNFASGTQTVAFPTAGTYDYHCSIHGLSMSGVVVVQ